jgi:O-antigen ligase
MTEHFVSVAAYPYYARERPPLQGWALPASYGSCFVAPGQRTFMRGTASDDPSAAGAGLPRAQGVQTSGPNGWLMYIRLAAIITMFCYAAGYATIGFGLLFLAFVWRLVTGRPPLWQPTAADRPLAAFGAILLLSMIASPYIRTAFPVTMMLLLSGAVYFGSMCWLFHRDPRSQITVLRAWALGSPLAALVGLATSAPPRGRAWIPHGVGPNGLGTALLLGTILALGLSFRARGLERVMWLACGFVGLLGLLASGSRASLVGLIVGVVYLAWRLLRGRPRRLASALAAGAVVLVVAGTVIPQLRERVSSTLQDVSLNRFQIWRTSHRMISARPVLGTGFGTFEHAYEKWKVPNTSSEPFAFNLALNIAVETGLAGLIAAVWTAIAVSTYWVQSGRRAPASDVPFRALIGALWVGLLVDQFADNTLFSISTSAALWVLLALSLAPRSAERRSAGAISPV